MKFIAIAVLLASQAQAAPYFRVLNYSHPKPVIGAMLAPESLGNTEAASLLPLITHSPKDGCLLPYIVCEDWAPLTAGASINSGNITLDIAPLVNVLPWMLAGIDSFIPNGYSSPVAWMKEQGQFATFSAGPVLQYSQLHNKGYFRIFTGLALQF